ncbi:MAG: SGNH/GDSL hydrolase family protein [Oscillospiraceae bacterium]|nr:SGNH/GDSL hydrolase family protein [Oscillospiraceae bacterium]
MSKLIPVLLAAAVSITAYSAVSIVRNNSAENKVVETATVENMLEGKSIAFIGDSISYGANWYGGYGKIIGEQNNMIVTNPSIGGATFARNITWSADSEGLRPSIIDMTDKLTDKYDYIIVEGGVNDFWNHVELGALTEGFDGGYDELTMTGAIESTFFRLRENHPESKTGFVIIHNPFTYNAEGDFAPYYEMLKAVCDKWEVPYIDLYAANNAETGVNVKDAEMNKIYFGSESSPEGDGCHPNEEGYRKIYVEPMVPWLKTM